MFYISKVLLSLNIKIKQIEIMYLTEKQENKIYNQIIKKFELNFGDVMNVETKFITESYNYFIINNDNGVYAVDFKTLNGKLLIKSVITKEI